MTSSLSRLLGTVLLVVVAAAGYVFWYYLIAGMSTRAAELASLIDAKTAAQNRVAALRATLNQLASDEAEIRKYFISTDGVVTFLEDLQARGKAVGAEVKVVSVSTATNAGRPALQVALTITGPFAAVMDTVGRIEYVPYALTVNTLAVNRGVSASGVSSAEWSASMTVSVGSTGAASGNEASVPGNSTKPSSSATTTGATPSKSL